MWIRQAQFPRGNDSKVKQYEQTKSHGNERVKCPMCQVSFPNNDNGNSSLNAHIDECLNLATVKQLVNEETICAEDKVTNKKGRLTDFFASEYNVDLINILLT